MPGVVTAMFAKATNAVYNYLNIKNRDYLILNSLLGIILTFEYSSIWTVVWFWLNFLDMLLI